MAQLADIRSRFAATMSRNQEEVEVSRIEPKYDYFIDQSLLATRLCLDNGPKAFKNSMTNSESRLENLPVELYQGCLQYLDIETLTGMRRVSQRTRHAIDNLHQYKELYENAPQALRACLATEVAPYIPLLRLHDSLISMECYYCKKSDPSKAAFGSCLSVFEGRRACLFCIRNNPELKPLEFTVFASLCAHRKRSFRGISNLCLLRTITGTYGPSRTHSGKSTLLLGSSIAPAPGNSLTEKEQRAFYGNTRSATIYHHPLHHPRFESNISEQIGFVAPDELKQATHRYVTAVRFPYLTTAGKVCENGRVCVHCNLHMSFKEKEWKVEQTTRRRNLHNPIASLRRRNAINSARRMASMEYTESEEALRDQKELSMKMVNDNGFWTNMSWQEHNLTHENERLSPDERHYRDIMSPSVVSGVLNMM